MEGRYGRESFEEEIKAGPGGVRLLRVMKPRPVVMRAWAGIGEVLEGEW